MENNGMYAWCIASLIINFSTAVLGYVLCHTHLLRKNVDTGLYGYRFDIYRPSIVCCITHMCHTGHHDTEIQGRTQSSDDVRNYVHLMKTLHLTTCVSIDSTMEEK